MLSQNQQKCDFELRIQLRNTYQNGKRTCGNWVTYYTAPDDLDEYYFKHEKETRLRR